MAITLEQVQDKIIQRLKATLPSARVEEGWPQIYLNGNKTWPLITIAPVFDSSLAKGTSGQTSTVFEIRVMEKATPGVMKSLIKKRFSLRKALFATDPTYERSLIKPAFEPEALEFHEPLPHQPYAGFTLLIQMNFFESQENI